MATRPKSVPSALVRPEGTVDAFAHDRELFAAPDSGSPVARPGDAVEQIMEQPRVGTVKWFNTTKGYGFIQPADGGSEVFVHISAVERAGMRGLNEGQVLHFQVEPRGGKPSAEHLKKLS
jgi:CspA family cold shock protein